jgi:hypothetical protein
MNLAFIPLCRVIHRRAKCGRIDMSAFVLHYGREGDRTALRGASEVCDPTSKLTHHPSQTTSRIAKLEDQDRQRENQSDDVRV